MTATDELCRMLDELREVAYKVDEYQMGRERVPLKTAAIMREAADTIWHLRDDLQQTNAENAKLRELLHDFLCEHADYFAEGNYYIGDLDLEHAMHHNQAFFRREAKKLGVEVD